MEQDLQAQPSSVPIYDGPGSTSDRVVDIGSNDPLVNLGLVDPKSGAALPSDDWQPAAPVSQPAPQVAQPQQVTQQPAPSQASAQQYQLQVATLQNQAAQAYHEAVSRGADPNAAEQIIGARLEAEIAKTRANDREAATLPIAKQMVAQKIASTHGMNHVRPEELLVYDTPHAMEAAASQLATARRAGNYQARVAAGTDRSESGAPGRGLAPAIANLSAEKKIELGIRRGQFS
jgi:hypothetical protein